MPDRGKLIVLSGPSGAGKSTVIQRVRAARPNLRFSVSATTRQPRTGEVEGEDYYFVSELRFLEMLARGELLENAQYVGNRYGTPRAPIEEHLNQGRDVLLDIEVQGAAQVKAAMPEAVTIFLSPPNLETLRQRLVQRGTDSPEVIEGRLQQARVELLLAKEYDYIVINDDAAIAAAEISAILTAEKCKTADRIQLIEVQLQ